MANIFKFQPRLVLPEGTQLVMWGPISETYHNLLTGEHWKREIWPDGKPVEGDIKASGSDL